MSTCQMSRVKSVMGSSTIAIILSCPLLKVLLETACVQQMILTMTVYRMFVCQQTVQISMGVLVLQVMLMPMAMLLTVRFQQPLQR